MKNLYVLLFSVFILLSFQSHSQSFKADSLFENKKYIEAINQYDSVFQSGFYSESMILKMAYINEGLGNNEEAIYYLSFLNREKPSMELQNKIEELSVENGFSGYSFDDLSVVQLWLKNNHRTILLVSLVVLGICIVAFLLDLKYAKIYKQIMPVAVLSIIITVTFSTVDMYSNQGVVVKENCVVYQSDSELSPQIKAIKKGNIVTLLKSSDTWSLVQIGEEQEGYIKANKLKLLLN